MNKKRIENLRRLPKKVKGGCWAVENGRRCYNKHQGRGYCPAHYALLRSGGWPEVPVVPVGLRGTRQVLPRESLAVRTGDVEVHVGAPLRAADFASVPEFVAHTRAEVARLSDMPTAD